MATHISAEKRNRQTIRRTTRNIALRSRMKTAVKDLRTLILAKKADEATKLLPKVMSVVASTAQKGVIKKQAASRTISRMSAQISKLSKRK